MSYFQRKSPLYVISKNEVYRRAKFAKEKLVEIIQVNVPIFCCWHNLKNKEARAFKRVFEPFWQRRAKKAENLSFWRMVSLFLRFRQKGKKLNIDLDDFQQLFFCKLCSTINFIFRHYIMLFRWKWGVFQVAAICGTLNQKTINIFVIYVQKCVVWTPAFAGPAMLSKCLAASKIHIFMAFYYI